MLGEEKEWRSRRRRSKRKMGNEKGKKGRVVWVLENQIKKRQTSLPPANHWAALSDVLAP